MGSPSPPEAEVAAILADDGVLTLVSRVGKLRSAEDCEVFHDPS